MRGKGSDRILLGIYVDDLIISGSGELVISEFKQEMKRIFKMSDMGKLSLYLGLEVQQKATGIIVTQTGYAPRILEKSGMSDCNSCSSPTENHLKLSKNSTAKPVDATEFRSIMGCTTRHHFCYHLSEQIHGEANSGTHGGCEAPAVIYCWLSKLWLFLSQELD
jgi:hypothetical protein